MKISLVISTYNRPDALAVCLDSIRRQTLLPDEVIVGDDGSGQATADLIKEFQRDFPVPLIHVWQEDQGYRLAAIRNKSVAAASGDYIIESDGDMVFHRRFVEDHAALARRGCFVKGNRVKLAPALTDEICSSGKSRVIGAFCSGIESRRSQAVHCMPVARIFAAFFKKGKIYGLGCNMAFWRDDYLAVNGYDESFNGWGKEDDDLTNRLHRLGREKRDVRFAALAYHLWHPHNNADTNTANARLLAANNEAAVVACDKGVSQYL